MKKTTTTAKSAANKPKVKSADQNVPRHAFLKTKKAKVVSLFLAITLLVVGSSALAYYAVIAPNQPENIIETAITKQLQKDQVTTKGSLSTDTKDDTLVAKNVTVTFKTASDTQKKAFSAELEAAVAGTKLPIEIRIVESTLYIKFGDLASAKTLATLTGNSDVNDLVDLLGDNVANQWIELDQSLLKQANAGCTTGVLQSVSDQDVEGLTEAYSKNPFATVTGESADTVDGKEVTKYDIAFDKQKGMAFSSSVQGLDVFKKVSDCAKTTMGRSDGDSQASDKNKAESKDMTATMSVWIDGDKNLRQIEIKFVSADASTTLLVTFTDEPVDIQKPQDAKSLLEVFGGNFSQLLGLDDLNVGQDSVNNPLDALSDSCKSAYQQYITSGGQTALPTGCL